MGTDEFGRDLLSRIIHGARTSLSVAITVIAISVVAGMTLGAMAGYFGGLFDRMLTAAMDLTWSFPEILIALLLIAIIGTGTESITVAISIAYLAQFTRLTRAQVVALRSETYVEATVNLGAGYAHVIFRHLLPNAITPVIVARRRRAEFRHRGWAVAASIRCSGPWRPVSTTPDAGATPDRIGPRSARSGPARSSGSG